MSDPAIVTCVVSWALAFVLVGWMALDGFRRKLSVDRERLEHLARYEKEYQSMLATLKDMDRAWQAELSKLKAGQLGALTGGRRPIHVE